MGQPFLEQRIAKNLLARKLDFPDLLLVRELNLRSVPRHMELHAGDQVILILLPLFRAEYLLDTISSHLCVVEILRRDQIVEDVRVQVLSAEYALDFPIVSRRIQIMH